MKPSTLFYGVSVVGIMALAGAEFLTAQVIPQPGPPQVIGCAYNSTQPTLTTGQAGWVQCDAAGNLLAATGTSPSPTAATTRVQSGAAGSNLVIKSGAGNLYDLTVTVGAVSGYVMLFNATALPADGAVTPVWCARVVSDGVTGTLAAAWPTPFAFATGITAGFSTTGCFTLTASTTAAFFGGYK